ncbi:hypothetical protein E9531_04485 [Lampropedia puyangensis]|uniref:Uncharacterized protein n=1 Tax=Lampropedia puyangensis TaxID=1330072 RepID=A0A4S8F914_9BURK|nr:DUF6348 family protein [Lampropedia puyangensis]THU03990.1 hypothetical protein E9531_04485 [Lampropedia puyangensis]
MTLNELATQYLQAALEAHQLSFNPAGAWLEVDQRAAHMQVQVYEKPDIGQARMVVLELQVHATVLGEAPIVETYAGFGTTHEDAVRYAFSRLLQGSFHPIIEALTSHQCEEGQAETEVWTGPAENGSAQWQVFLGALQPQGEGEPLLDTYLDIFDELKALLTQTAPNAHWLRIYLCTSANEVQAIEVLLDNQPWEEGAALLQTVEWPKQAPFAALRHFMLAIPRGAN